MGCTFALPVINAWMVFPNIGVCGEAFGVGEFSSFSMRLSESPRLGVRAQEILDDMPNRRSITD